MKPIKWEQIKQLENNGEHYTAMIKFEPKSRLTPNRRKTYKSFPKRRCKVFPLREPVE